ncbi:MAG: hypothetical protein XU15_C0026G0017 [candidate division NC10 bacterium CSP1-5]|nr:MAG: hypothetical protein XU15_C0026G0017 [candidate division NC10 bacterium CSP1-5]
MPPSPLEQLRIFFQRAEDRPQATTLADIIQGGLRAAAPPESLAEAATPFVGPEPAAQDLTGFGAGLVEAGEISRQAIRSRLGLTGLAPGPQQVVEPAAVPREETGEGLLSARTAGALAPFLLGAAPAAAGTLLPRAALGATEAIAATFEPGETTLGEAVLMGGAGAIGGALLGPRSPISPTIAKGLREVSDDVGAANLVSKFPKLTLKKGLVEELPSGARAADVGTQPFRRLIGDPQFQYDTIVKKHFTKDYGFDDKTTRRFMERLTPEERQAMATEVEQSGMRAISAINRALGNEPKLAQEAQKVLLDLPAPRTAISDEAGFFQLDRLISSSPDAPGVVRRAVDRAQKATRKLPAQSLILNAYMSSPFGRVRDFLGTMGNTVAQGVSSGAKARNFHVYAGMKNAIFDGWRSAAEGWRTGINRELREVIAEGRLPKEYIDELQRIGRVTPEIAQQLKQGGAQIPEELLEGVVMLRQGNGLRDILSRIPFTPGRFNSAQDDFFTTIAFNLQANLRASQKTAAEGVSSAKFGKRFVENLSNLNDGEIADAWDTARRVSFREHNISGATQKVIDAGRLFRQIPFFGPYVLAPFVRTPSVIAQRTLEYNPANILLGGLRMLAKDSPTREMGKLSFQRGMVGLTGVAAAGTLADAGVITGAGEHLTDSEKDAAIRAGRWAPYSVKLGDRWVSYRGWGPPAGLLSLASNMVEKHKAGKIQTPGDFAEQFSISSLHSAMDATFLPNMAQFITNLMEGRRAKESFSDSVLRVFQPIGLVSEVARALDPRLTGGVGVERISERIPGERAGVPERGAQTFGESPEVPGGFIERIFGPRQVQRSQDPLVNYLADRGVLPGRPSLPVFAREEGIKLTEREKNTILLAKGKAERRAAQKAINNTLGFATLSIETQRDIINSAINRARTDMNTAVKERKRRGLPLDLRILLLQTG